MGAEKIAVGGGKLVGGGRFIGGAMRLCLVVHCAALFSNSFIVAGRAVAHFLYTTLLLLCGVWGVCWWDNAGSPARKRALSTRGQMEGQCCTGRLVAVVSMMFLGRIALEYVALSHEKGAREAGDTSVRAALGLAFLIFAQESGGTRKRSALAACSRVISFMASNSQKSLCIVNLNRKCSRVLTFRRSVSVSLFSGPCSSPSSFRARVGGCGWGCPA